MGLYTNSSRYGNSYAYSDEITANESYNAALGCAHIMMDVQANDMAFFEGVIKDDVREVTSYNEGVSYVNENALTDIIKKIVEMFKKLVAKIKGIIKSFIAKLNGAFKNAKGLVKKYEKQIIKYGNWTGFKVKDIRVPKQDLDIGSIVDYVCDVEPKATEYNFGTGENKTFYGMRSEDINDGKYDKEDIRLHIIKDNYFTHLNITSAENTEDIKEEIYDAVFDEKDTIDDDVVKSGSYFAKPWIKPTLENSEKLIKEINKVEKKLNGWIDRIITDLNKTQNDLAKIIGDRNNGPKKLLDPSTNFTVSDRDEKGTSHTIKAYDGADLGIVSDKSNSRAENFQQVVRAAQTVAANEQEVITMTCSIAMDLAKFGIAQARKIWTAAAAWSSGVHKEGYEYIEALGDCSAEEFYSNMNSIAQ